jgi:hypothetical protein
MVGEFGYRIVVESGRWSLGSSVQVVEVRSQGDKEGRAFSTLPCISLLGCDLPIGLNYLIATFKFGDGLVGSIRQCVNVIRSRNESSAEGRCPTQASGRPDFRC